MFTSPQFGQKATASQQKDYEKTGLFKAGKFRNDEKIHMKFNFDKLKKILTGLRHRPDDLAPEQRLTPSTKITTALKQHLAKPAKATENYITWLSHSSFIVEVAGKRILLDPMFGMAASPVPLFVRRFNKLPIGVNDLPEIDAVLISHDHYDHLDYGSIKQLKHKVKHFYVPLGVGNHLRRWGVPNDRITELAWWQEAKLKQSNIVFSLTPSRHSSGRGITDQAMTLWGSWVIQSPNKTLFFSGDGGYGKHFKAIGKKYGPFDVALMECGQYSPNWKNIHMTPDESVQAAQDVNAKITMPIHWGAFVLSMHSWTEPAKKFTQLAKAKNVAHTTPEIGEVISLDHIKPTQNWWQQIEK